MAGCGCSGAKAVGLGARSASSMSDVDRENAMWQNKIVYRLLQPGTSDPDDCVVKIDGDNSQCKNFPSLQSAEQFKSSNNIKGTPVGVIVPVPV